MGKRKRARERGEHEGEGAHIVAVDKDTVDVVGNLMASLVPRAFPRMVTSSNASVILKSLVPSASLRWADSRESPCRQGFLRACLQNETAPEKL